MNCFCCMILWMIMLNDVNNKYVSMIIINDSCDIIDKDIENDK